MDGIPAASPSPLNPPPIPTVEGFQFNALIYFLIVAFFIIICLVDEYRSHRLDNAASAPDPSLEERRIKEIAAGCTECAICLEEYSADGEGVERRTLRPCGHRFRKHCIDAWLRKEPRGCPMCRGVLEGSSLSVHHVVNVNDR